MAPYWWIVIGISVVGKIKNDLIFSKEKIDPRQELLKRYERMRDIYNNRLPS